MAGRRYLWTGRVSVRRLLGIVMNLEPIDPEWLKADLRRALEFHDAGRTDQAIASLEAYAAKLRELLSNLEQLEASLFPTGQAPRQIERP
jgi:hypothetical protein